jgi:diguanylate cyclase (GGDEF)-like protein
LAIEAAESTIDAQEQMRLHQRIFQFSMVVLAAYVVTAVLYGLQGRLDVTLILTIGALCMPLCIWLNRRSHYTASLFLLLVVTASLSAIMWRSDGLKDSALLGFPVILVGSAQLLKPRHFVAVVVAMLFFVLLLGLGTMQGWRPTLVAGTDMDRITDTVTILGLGGYLIWLLTDDMHKSLARLGTQIANLHASEKHLTFLAQHDVLTTLPNRVLGSELIEKAMAGCARHDTMVALLFVDLDNFKDINDSLGHSAGDQFLKEVAARLLASVRASDVVCRQGGDEFLIGLTDIPDTQGISQVAETMLKRMQAPFVLRDIEILPSCSIGIAIYPQDGENFETTLKHADLAMYQAKEAGRNTYRFFDDIINTSIRENLHLVSRMRSALAQHEFVLHYQPVIDLATGAVVGAEALVRWQSPTLGLISPAQFIPTAEKSGLIVELGQWVLEEACRQMRLWQDQGAPAMTIAVNLSPVQFRRGGVELVVERALRNSGLHPHCLELEVTESTLVQDTEKFIQSLERIKALGVRIAIDDFGTGYSNLSYLQRFAVDKLKIDQSFVKRLLNAPQDTAIVNAIIQMAKSLDLTTNAEGVEDHAIRAQLAMMGCELAQGYLFSQPLPADQFEAYMQTHYAANSHNRLAPSTALG